MKTLLTVVEAKREFEKLCTPVGTEIVALQEASGRVLAQDVSATSDSPLFDNSAMDGFAVRLDNEAFVSAGRTFNIVGESAAGAPFEGKLNDGDSVYISTGAKVPDETMTVVRKEDTLVQGDTLTVTVDVLAHKNIRRQAEEWRHEDVLLQSGRLISPADIGVIASQGYTEVSVGRQPRVAILSTGTELVSVNETPQEGKIRNSNLPMLKSAVAHAGGVCVHETHVDDDFEQHVEAFRSVVNSANIVLCTGGVSVGDHDHVLEATQEAGFQPVFWKVRQKPGKPLYLAHKEECVFVGLPGNPVSALMCFEVYICPLLRNMSGMQFQAKTMFGILSKRIVNQALRDEFVRVAPTMEGMVAPTSGQGSHMLSGVTNSIGYVHVPAQTEMQVGQTVLVHLFGWS